MPQNGDRELIGRILDGDAEAGEELCGRLYRSVRGPVARILGRSDPSAIEEAVQNAFLRLYENDMRELRAFEGEDLGPIVRAIAKNMALRVWRGEAPTVRIDAPEDQASEPTPIPDARPSPGEVILVRERRQSIERAMARLPGRDGRVVRRLYLDEADRRTVAEEERVAANSLDQIVYRARLRLRDELNPGGFRGK
jgi:RNA polymerase sigma factor (sigma-70 family)